MNMIHQKHNHTKALVLSAALVCAVLTIAVGIAKEANKNPEPVFTVDTAPIERGLNNGESYSHIVKKVRPSIVSIYTSKTIQLNSMSDMGGISPFFDDPLFRRFFGERNAPQQQEPRKQKQTGLGSGVIVTKDGYILTNNHVVDGSDEIKVAIHGTDNTYEAKIVGKDPSADLAVLKIDAKDLPEATLGDSDGVEEGDVVLAFGNPFGIGQTVTMGIVSATGCNPHMDSMTYENFIQTDAAINPGNSGGALIDSRGRLIGINTAIYSRTGGYQGIGWAIPINTAKSSMKQLIQNGKVARGYLGVTIQKLTDDLAESFGMQDKEGALVGGVTPEGAADKAGIKTGDIITAVNDKKVKDNTALQMLIGSISPGEEVTLTIIRDGKEQKIVATLDERPIKFNEDGSVAEENDAGDTSLEGVTVTGLTSQLRKDAQIPDTIQGVFVNAVDVDSKAYEKGLRTGDVIQECNGQAISDVKTYKDAIKNADKKIYRLLVYSRSGNTTHFVVIKQ